VRLPSLLVILFVLSACPTNYYVNKPVKTLETHQKQTVYVTNPEHADYDLLKKSKIYNLTENQNHPDQLTIYIKPQFVSYRLQHQLFRT